MPTVTRKPNILIFTRKPGESFVLQDEDGKFLAEITVTKRSGNNVRLSVKAPEEIKINRSELLPKMTEDRWDN